MKKEINELLNSKDAILKLNKVARLHRWQVDGLGYDCDALKIEFDNPTGCVSFFSKEIKSREFKYIVQEIEEATREFARKWEEKMISEIHNGYIINPKVTKLDSEGGNLRKRRMDAGITQQALADAAGISIKTLQDYEGGRKDISRAAGETLRKLAGALGCRVEDIIW